MSDTLLNKSLGEFAAPRDPELVQTGLMDDLFAKACVLCGRPSRRMNMQPGFGMKKGERVLLGVDSSYDLRVVEALQTAAREIGAKMDVVVVESAGPQRSMYHITDTPLDGADEARSVQRSISLDTRRNPYLVREIADKHHYDLVIQGTGGPIPDTDYRWERLPWATVEHWAGEEITFPVELQMVIDKVVWEQIERCVRVHFTDPEGTDISFTNYNDNRWLYQSHQWGKPLYITAQEDATGVIAGTTNHRGVFEWCEATVDGGLITFVKGGGDYGEIWREKLDEFKDLILPSYKTRKIAGSREVPHKHRPGFFWYWECAIGTMPKVFRPAGQLFDLLYERRRSGLVHHGFGPNTDEVPALAELGLPTRHVHIHNLFSTYVGTAASGEKITVIDRGRLTALDDPRVRAVAEKYGDPDKLLAEAWVPEIPGINAPGEYAKNFAGDVRKHVLDWARRRGEQISAGSSSDKEQSSSRQSTASATAQSGPGEARRP